MIERTTRSASAAGRIKSAQDDALDWLALSTGLALVRRPQPRPAAW